MKKIFYLFIILNSITGFAQCKTEIITTILEEHIEKELPRLDLKKDNIIIVVSINGLDKKDILIGIDAFPLDTYPKTDNLKKINGVRVKFYFENISKKLIKKINKRFITINEIRNIETSNISNLTHYKGIATFQINKKNELYIISTSDDDYYYNRFKKKKLKFSKNLKFSKDINN